MQVDGCIFMADSVTKFYNTVRVFGWFHHPFDTLESVNLIDSKLIQSLSRCGVEHGGVLDLGPNKGFEIQALRSVDDIDESVAIEFRTKKKRCIKVSLHELCKDRIESYPGPQLAQRFIKEVNNKNCSVLDIGGRSRSGRDRRKDFDVSDYVVMDILPGENVDVVGDAHALGTLFPAERFDAFYSVSVFEHLMMPWAVVPQINQVLKLGGIGLISTHQTLGMHDLPWDFWRFSDTAWDALFNKQTGFEIVERTLDFEVHILPFIYRPEKSEAERSAGFEGSAVWVRKIGPCQLSWKVTPADVTQTMYPDHEDSFKPDGFCAADSVAD